MRKTFALLNREQNATVGYISFYFLMAVVGLALGTI